MVKKSLIVFIFLIVLPMVGYHAYDAKKSKKDAYEALKEIDQYIKDYEFALDHFAIRFQSCLYENEKCRNSEEEMVHFPRILETKVIRRLDKYTSRYTTGTIVSEGLVLKNAIAALEKQRSNVFVYTITSDGQVSYLGSGGSIFLISNGTVTQIEDVKFNQKRSHDISRGIHSAKTYLSSLRSDLSVFRQRNMTNYSGE